MSRSHGPYWGDHGSEPRPSTMPEPNPYESPLAHDERPKTAEMQEKTRVRRRAALRIVKSLALLVGYFVLLAYVLSCIVAFVAAVRRGGH